MVLGPFDSGPAGGHGPRRRHACSAPKARQAAGSDASVRVLRLTMRLRKAILLAYLGSRQRVVVSTLSREAARITVAGSRAECAPLFSGVVATGTPVFSGFTSARQRWTLTALTLSTSRAKSVVDHVALGDGVGERRSPMTRAGFPPTIVKGSTSRVTTAPAPTMAPLPIRLP